MKPRYYRLDELVRMINEPNCSACSRILMDNKELFRSARGSTHNHQARTTSWLGPDPWRGLTLATFFYKLLS